MAERLLAQGYAVVVYNRTKSKTDALVERGAEWSENPFVECERIVVSLYTTDVVKEVLARMEPAMRPGQLLIDTTTGDPVETPALGARLAKRGVRYLEAPVSGSSAQARRGEVTVIVAGEREAHEACADIFADVAARTFFVGPWGNGVRMKLVTNLVLGLNRAVLAEGLGFAKSIGLGASEALEVLRNSAATSGVMFTKGEKMITGDFTPQAKLSQHLKDVRIILGEGERAAIDLPLSKLHCELLSGLERDGYGAEDNCAIIRAFDK